ncbi:MAG TPA: Crp/Fnr family transcriptional regulator [Micropepsaceae bacterium]|nr:Crp/Fnr family transcriptional regulator [Micropepsaceae bacterium]
MTRSSRNHLLCALSPQDYGLLEGHLTKMVFAIRQSFEESNKPIEHVYFPEDGVVSIVAKSRHEQAEAAIVGREGMTGIPVVLGNDRWVNDTYVQVDGSGFQIAADDLRRALAKSATLRSVLLAFTQSFVVQTAQTALANARGNVEGRLARWLLMAHDRLEGNELALTHEFLALMLGVRRAGVTTALQKLENDALVVAKRGLIVVENRAGLVRLADRLYGVAEAEYRRLIPGSQFGLEKT